MKTQPPQALTETEEEKQFERAQKLYSEGRFIEAFPMYYDLASRGRVGCQRFVGWMYFVGEGVNQDYEKAYQWFANAATRADREAMFGLGKTCLVLNRDDEALKWLNAACAAEFLPACFWLGWMYERGRCGTPDPREAYGYFSRAYTKGHLPSGRGAASMLMKGCCGWLGRFWGAALWIKVAAQITVAAFRDRKSRRLMI